MVIRKVIFALLALWLLTGHSDAQISRRSGRKVDERSFMVLGGERQYVEITGESDKNPVLLFIHGGPGWPQTPQLRYFNAEITKDFTLVAWDQRGAGLSFMENPAPKNVTLEQILADAGELTATLRKRFGQRKIYLAGYSWGSIVGMNLVLKHPDHYAAYIGIAQIVNIRRGMEISRSWLAARASEKGDSETLRTLDKLRNPTKDFCAGDLQCFIKQYELVMKYGGAVHNREADKENEIALSKYDDYKSYDWNKGFEFSAAALAKDMFAADFSNVKELRLPVYLFLGRHDWNVPSVLAEEFFNNLSAPKKTIVWMENSGHSPLEEEPKEFNRRLVETVLDRR